MDETNGGGSPEDVEGFDFLRAVTAGFRSDSVFGPTLLRDRPDAGYFSRSMPNPSGTGEDFTNARPEKVIGFDSRKRVTQTSLTPWRCICHLEVEYDRGPVGYATGFFAGPDLVLTAAHVLADRTVYGWTEKARIAKRVRIVPGRDGSLAPYGSYVERIPSSGKDFLIPDEWTRVATRKTSLEDRQKEAESSDFAGIRLRDTKKVLAEQFGNRLGYFGLQDFEKLEDSGKLLFVNTAGYPDTANKPYGTLWYNAGRVHDGLDEDGIIDYMIDTEGGQSGSPVYYFDKKANQRYVVAIHTTGDFVNRGLAIHGRVFDTIKTWRGTV